MRACYKMYSIVQRVYPLTVDSLLSPGTLSIAFVILNYFTPKVSNEIPTYIRRSRKVIHNFLKNVEDHGKKKSTGWPSLSDRDKRVILRVALNSQLMQTINEANNGKI